MAARIYVGGINPTLSEKDLEDEVPLCNIYVVGGTGALSLTQSDARLLTLVCWQFIRFGTLRSVWVARKPPGFGELHPLFHYFLPPTGSDFF